MALFTISDFHLSLNQVKPMNVFGANWLNHEDKIKENWLNTVTEEDTVLIPGDLSWSMKIDDGIEDLGWVHALPGKKIFVKGNHDYWWASYSKISALYEDIKFIQNNHFEYGDYAICGTRGWICPSNDSFTTHDRKIYSREIGRLKLSLDSARKKGYEKIIVMLHYPPTNERFDTSGFVELINEYNVEKVIYGHLHGPFNYKVLEGYIGDTEYILASCDYLDFMPKKIF